MAAAALVVGGIALSGATGSARPDAIDQDGPPSALCISVPALSQQLADASDATPFAQQQAGLRQAADAADDLRADAPADLVARVRVVAAQVDQLATRAEQVASADALDRDPVAARDVAALQVTTAALYDWVQRHC